LKEISIAHFSDIHFSKIENITFRQLLSKRLYGYIYWYLGRNKRYNYAILNALRKDLLTEDISHIVITGDLVHLSLPDEFISIKKWLETIGGADKITVIPGNHDFYVPSGKRLYGNAWNSYITGSSEYITKNKKFPFVKIIKNVAIIGVDSNVITPPFFAYGFLGKSQLKDLENLLSKIPDGLFTVLLIHHPPVKGVATNNNSLVDMKVITEIIKSGKIKLILHGHTHYYNISCIDSKIGKVPVIGVPPAVSIETNKVAGYNIYYISDIKQHWKLTVKRKEFSMQKNIFEVKELQEFTIDQ
jgi:3',5'-cyclic AMP phosphodiesterase CpdA